MTEGRLGLYYPVGSDIADTFYEAIRMRDLGESDVALQILDSILESKPNELSSRLVRGQLQKDLLQFEKAIEDFRYITLADDIAQYHICSLASRSLFHSLLRVGQMQEAFMEAERYFSLVGKDHFVAYYKTYTELKELSPRWSAEDIARKLNE